MVCDLVEILTGLGDGDFTAFLDILYSQKVNMVEEDHLRWDHTKSGRFEVRSYYRLTYSGGSPDFPWKSVWQVKVPHKVAFFTWLAAHGKNLTIDNLRRCKFWVLYVQKGGGNSGSSLPSL